MGYAEQSVTYADRSGDGFMSEVTRTKHADALHQSGRRTKAESRFREAEQIQAERQPAYPLLYSLPGFQYCDLLLAEAERAAWKRTHAKARSREEENLSALAASRETLDRLQALLDRAKQMFEWRLPGDPLLDIALDHLTLGRAALYEAILGESEISNSKSQIEQAVSGLRRAGTQHELPRGLLTRAWHRSLTGRRSGLESAQSDLDETWEIAARGPMPLYLADIHLHRARLFARMRDEGGRMNEEDYPWESPEHDLREARRLIEKHGYGRRKEELEDAEAALRGS